MILVLSYFNRSHQEIFVETTYDIDWDDDDEEEFYDSDEYKTQVYTLKLVILQQYYGDEYKSEIVDNQAKYEEVFDEQFEYTITVIPR
jgi:hypothetical protein